LLGLFKLQKTGLCCNSLLQCLHAGGWWAVGPPSACMQRLCSAGILVQISYFLPTC
jgi:hypothetical protein